MKTIWNGKRVTILGSARQGLAAARWLARHGAKVTVNDRRSPEEMAAARTAFETGNAPETAIQWVLGDHPVEILDTTDALCLSGGVPLDNPLVIEAVKRGIPLTNDTQIFMENVPCKTVGITGSAGKTTTTSLLGNMAKATMGAKAHVGGNIGDPLLNYLDEMKNDDLAILEVSSFQLEQMTLSPHVAVILNITPNHLDRHGTMDAYTSAKQRILDFQGGEDSAILCREDAGSWKMHDRVRGNLVTFGTSPIPGNQDGTTMKGDLLVMQQRGVETPLMRREKLQLPGNHNLLNVLGAFAIGQTLNLPLDAMRKASQEFKGVSHRLELVREWNGVKWVNGSIATAPERTMADIRSFTEPIVLLLGGRDKNLPWEDLAALIHTRVDHVILFGEAKEKIVSAIGTTRNGSLPQTIEVCGNLQDAVVAAIKTAQQGDVVLLSPGCTSFDEFRDFEERGEAFKKWVWELS